MISWKKVSQNLTLERMGYTESINIIPRYLHPPNCGRTTCPQCSSRDEVPLFPAIKNSKLMIIWQYFPFFLILMLLCCCSSCSKGGRGRGASLTPQLETGLRVGLLNCRCRWISESPSGKKRNLSFWGKQSSKWTSDRYSFGRLCKPVRVFPDPGILVLHFVVWIRHLYS